MQSGFLDTAESLQMQKSYYLNLGLYKMNGIELIDYLCYKLKLENRLLRDSNVVDLLSKLSDKELQKLVQFGTEQHATKCMHD